MPTHLSCSGRTRLLWLSLFASLSCATTPPDFETPRGPRSGDQPGPWVILGVLNRNTSSLKRANATEPFQEGVRVDVPVGTELIIPTIRGFGAGYGRTDPEDLSGGGSFTWHAADHHLGVLYLNVQVVDINAPDNSTTPPSQSASLTVTALLADDNLDDQWFGTINYTLLCLGRPQGPVIGPASVTKKP